MHNLIIALLVMMIGSATSGLARAEESNAPTSHTTQYIYCNVYLDTVCFGVAAGDTMTMQIPSDFVLDTVQLHDGIKAIIYQGNHPEDVFAGKTPINCPVATDSYRCSFIKSNQTYDIVYQSTENAPVIHIRLTGVTNKRRGEALSFLYGFRKCHAVGQSVQCTEDLVFKGVE